MFFLFVPSWEKEEWRRQYRGKRHFKVFPPFLTHHVTHTRRAHTAHGVFMVCISIRSCHGCPADFLPFRSTKSTFLIRFPFFFLSVLSVLLVVVVPFGVFHSKFSPRFFCLTSAEVWRRKSFSWSRQCTYVAVWDIYMIHTRRNETTAAAATTKRERREKTTTRKLSNSHSSAVALY